MKEILIRLLVAALLTFAAFSLSSSARGQQTVPSPARQPVQAPQAFPQTRPSSEDHAGAPTGAFSGDNDQTQDALVFTGRIAWAKGILVLMDPVARITYQLDDQARVRPFAGRSVKVVGKLEMKSNTIRIDTISLRR